MLSRSIHHHHFPSKIIYSVSQQRTYKKLPLIKRTNLHHILLNAQKDASRVPFSRQPVPHKIKSAPDMPKFLLQELIFQSFLKTNDIYTLLLNKIHHLSPPVRLTPPSHIPEKHLHLITSEPFPSTLF